MESDPNERHRIFTKRAAGNVRKSGWFRRSRDSADKSKNTSEITYVKHRNVVSAVLAGYFSMDKTTLKRGAKKRYKRLHNILVLISRKRY